MTSPTLPPSPSAPPDTEDAAEMVFDAMVEEGSGFVPPEGMRCFLCGSFDVVISTGMDEMSGEQAQWVECNVCQSRMKYH